MSQRNDNLLLKRQMCAFSCDMSEDYAPSFVFVALMVVIHEITEKVEAFRNTIKASSIHFVDKIPYIVNLFIRHF